MSAPARLDRSLIRVSGPDARAFLQNVLTQNLDGLDAAGVLYGALLSPQGKVLADMMLWAELRGGVLIDADPTRGADLMRRLSMYKLRADAKLDDVSGAYAVLVSPERFEGARTDPRFPDSALGWRAIAAADGTENGAAAYEARRIALGVPDLARDAGPDEVFALEALLEELERCRLPEGLLCRTGERLAHEAARDDAEKVLSDGVRGAGARAGNAGDGGRRGIRQRAQRHGGARHRAVAA